MKRRSTFFHEGGATFDPQQLSLSPSSLTIRDLDAARQERFTLDIDELSDDIRELLGQCNELHIRWASQFYHDAIGPFSSRLAPGLHVQYSPRTDNSKSDSLCLALKRAFGDELKCTSPESTFTQIECHPSQKCPPGLLQYHQLHPTLKRFVSYAQESVCHHDDHTCRERLHHLLSADSLDIDYDSSSAAVKVTSFWSKPHTESGLWTEKIESKQHDASRSEVGVLALQQATQAQKLSVGGFLATIGEHDELKSTLFAFASRHHPLPNTATYTVHFQEPTGLHPTLQITLPPESLIPPESTCSLHTYLTLPSPIFADKYQLGTTDDIYLSSHNLKTLNHASGELDLEAADWTVEKWGSSILLELSPNREDNNRNQADNAGDGKPNSSMRVTIPLHLRYLRPSADGYRNISVPWPVVFWACSSPAERFSPFDRRHLGYDTLFDRNTLFYHLHPAKETIDDHDDTAAADGGVGGGGGGGDSVLDNHALAPSLTERIRVPVLRIDDSAGILHQARFIELTTTVVILAGFFWVLHKLRLVYLASRVEEKGVDESSNNEENKKTR